jgi:hypothetical protein
VASLSVKRRPMTAPPGCRGLRSATLRVTARRPTTLGARDVCSLRVELAAGGLTTGHVPRHIREDAEDSALTPGARPGCSCRSHSDHRRRRRHCVEPESSFPRPASARFLWIGRAVEIDAE